MVCGSLASTIHGEPRATRDIDVVIDPGLEDIDRLVEAFTELHFYVGDARAALATRDMFNVIDPTSGWKADLIIRKDRPFSREELARRRPATIAGAETYITTPEDAILSKLEWYAMSGSDQQWRDIVAMIVANTGRLDDAYLDRWAEELGLDELLAEARSAVRTEIGET